MSADTDIPQENSLSSTRTARLSGNTLSESPTTQQDTTLTADATLDVQKTPSSQTPTSNSSLFKTLRSSLSSLQKSMLSSSTEDATTSSMRTSSEKDKQQDTTSEKNQPSTSGITPEEPIPNTNQPSPSPTAPSSNPNSDSDPKPSPLLPPQKTPTYIRLQKSRLSSTRAKQLLRAGARAHDDPPPPPELGACCGSSCDPCVSDLWREERSVWREVWGVDAVEEKGKGDGREGLEW